MESEKFDNTNFSSNERLGLCLSGGGALGYAHIGVLQALEEHGIIVDEIAGSSMGAIVGTFYAAGFSPSQMMQLIKEDKLYKITKLISFRPHFLHSGFSNHKMLRQLIKELIPHNCFEELQKPMHICVTNLKNANWEIVNSGLNLDVWVTASASIPGVFEAIKFRGTFYNDGGLLNNLPSQAMESRCDKILGVNLIPHLPALEINKPIDALATSVRVLLHQNSLQGLALCNFLIEPLAIKKYNEFSFEHYLEIYKYGYDSANEFLTRETDFVKTFQGIRTK